jgi:hypothetical protein
MSRHMCVVKVGDFLNALQSAEITLPRLDELEGKENVHLMHGFDRPCTSYFCDVDELDCAVGWHCSGFGCTEPISQGQAVAFWTPLRGYAGVQQALDAVALYIEY